MTDNLKRLAALAAETVPPETVVPTAAGFRVAFPGASVDFFSPGTGSFAYCRACVAEPDGHPLPAGFAEAALAGNFFWRGTEGAVLSLEAASGAVWLTDRFDDGAFADAAAFSEHSASFLRTLAAWRARLEGASAGTGPEDRP